VSKAEAYTLDVYCDSVVCERVSTAGGYRGSMFAQFVGENKRDVWAQAKKQGWVCLSDDLDQKQLCKRCAAIKPRPELK
jgi:hypothetical protein